MWQRITPPSGVAVSGGSTVEQISPSSRRDTGRGGQMSEPTLEFENLKLAYMVRGSAREVLRGVSFAIQPGEAYGLVGESGCGKSTAAYAAIRSLPRNARVLSGAVRLAGRDVLSLQKNELRDLRANTVSMVYQDPSQALNPTIRVGPQLIESFTVMGVDKHEALKRSKAILHSM